MAKDTDHPREIRQPVALDTDALAGLSAPERVAISDAAQTLVRQIRGGKPAQFNEAFLAAYDLSSPEGVALMQMAEALLRIPDPGTQTALICDKLGSAKWARQLRKADDWRVTGASFGLWLAARLSVATAAGPRTMASAALRQLSLPLIRRATTQAMRQLGTTFVLGETIDSALRKAQADMARGITFSFDMLGEAACTAPDAARYAKAYSTAITAIARRCNGATLHANPSISIKLSALHPRFEEAQAARIKAELLPIVLGLAEQAKAANMGLTIDAEEAERLALTQDVFAALLAAPSLAGWDGLGIVVQAYNRQAAGLITTLHNMAAAHDRRIAVRLVKGAYWDAEIKRAQVLGLTTFPVFTDKAATDQNYLLCAQRLLHMTGRIYPQFATHNAHTLTAVHHMTKKIGLAPTAFEFQRLHGMGEALHRIMRHHHGTACRIYAPVGAHQDLLAYLVRRLLENGANASFLHQLSDPAVAPATVARCPFAQTAAALHLPSGAELFAPARRNARGWDLSDRATLAALDKARAGWRHKGFAGRPAQDDSGGQSEPARALFNPALPDDQVGVCTRATPADVQRAIAAAHPWVAGLSRRKAALNKAADLLEEAAPRFFALLAREAGKTLPDALAELREAVDFLRYYATQATDSPDPGLWGCISPWNFPLAIFTGQIAAALASGHAVLAKPAPQTPLVAAEMIALLHRAGVPRQALHLLPGGAEVGEALCSEASLRGIAFTGSTATAQTINKRLAASARPGTPLIAETGGINAMIVDSTALPEQTVQDIITGAFRSAGQRCSALRCLYLQEDVAAPVLTMLCGAMDELRLGDPWELATDIGPVIDATAKRKIAAYLAQARAEGRLIHQIGAPKTGHFIGPAALRVTGIEDIAEEVFGPVLHIATYRAEQLSQVICAINGRGYGLTFGVQSRIASRTEKISAAMQVGNIYINRDQIGAIVGSQPFGGEGLSGTGPKAGGPQYLARFALRPAARATDYWARPADIKRLTEELTAARQATAGAPFALTMPGPTGERNQLSFSPRGPVLCLGPGAKAAQTQAAAIRALGGIAIAADGHLPAETLQELSPVSAVLWWGAAETGRDYAIALAKRPGPIIPLITSWPDRAHALHERHICTDTTAAGGNTALFAGHDTGGGA